MSDQPPVITGVPVIDAPRVLDWPADGGNQEPSLAEPTANLVSDLHAEISQCDMVLSTAGNYHMALKELWDLYLVKFPADDPLRNWCYTTSPPIAKQQITNGLVQFGNVTVRCRPQIAVGPGGIIDVLAKAGFTTGDAASICKTRGNVLLVKKGNPKHVFTVWDLGRSDVRVVTPNPASEAGSFAVYANSIYGIATCDQNPPAGITPRGLFDTIFNGASSNPQKWLSGKRIHHREILWSVAYGKADAAVIFYHLALHAISTFPKLFDIISLGGTPAKPKPVPGNLTEILYAVRIKGNWTEKQRIATEKLMALFQSDEFTSILVKYGLDRP
ncbi:MAG: substrate-binding domain-containing protein [Nitrospirota bacterium]